MSEPPFKAGQRSAIEGQPRSANPHPPGPPATGDAYPGAWHEWDKGWFTATMTARHEKQRQA